MLTLYRQYKYRSIMGTERPFDALRTTVYRAYICWRQFGDPELPIAVALYLVAAVLSVLILRELGA